MDKDPNKFPVFVPKLIKQQTALKGLVVGTCIGLCEVAMLYPTEYIKTQLQLDEKGEMKKFNGIVDCVKKTIERNGIQGLYRGLGLLLVCGPPRVGVRFGSHEWFTGLLRHHGNGTLSMSKKLVAGLSAGAVEGITIVTPMETIKVKIINDQRSSRPQYHGILHAIREIVKKEGIGGIYEGVSATLIRQSLSHGLRFFFMGVFNDLYTNHDENIRTPAPIVGLFGIIASTLMVYITNPIDVIKTRMQTGIAGHQYKSNLECGLDMLTNEGVNSFYKGSMTRCLHVSIGTVFTFVLYDYIMHF